MRGFTLKQGAAQPINEPDGTMRICSLALLLMALAGPAAAQMPPPQEWVRADAATVRLRPSAIASIPSILQAELQRRGCTIPQAFTGGPPHNVIRGHFRTGKIDWAVLCSRNRTSSILVFWSGLPTGASVLASRRDADYLQVTGPGRIGFSRMISVASPAHIRKPPPLDHDGIDDAFVEKASVVWYFHRGLWLRLAGAD